MEERERRFLFLFLSQPTNLDRAPLRVFFSLSLSSHCFFAPAHRRPAPRGRGAAQQRSKAASASQSINRRSPFSFPPLNLLPSLPQNLFPNAKAQVSFLFIIIPSDFFLVLLSIPKEKEKRRAAAFEGFAFNRSW